MLVLTRKIGETVCVGSNVEIVVIEAGRGRVKLGFAGPRDVSIRRGELADTLKLPKLEANDSMPAQQPQVAHSESPTGSVNQCRVLAGK